MNIIKFDSVDSTNTVAKRLARQGADEGCIVLADRQTCGRGRTGKHFHSPEGGIYMSIVLRPSFSAPDARLITPAAAVAVCRVLERRTGESFDIKWVNDIYKNGRKVCGILTESAPGKNGGLEWAVLGIGINLFPDGTPLPDELKSIVGYIYPAETPTDKTALAGEVAEEFFAIYPTITDRLFADEYRRRMFLTGKTVTVIKDGCELSAEVLGTDGDLRLLVRFGDGNETALGAGEVSIKL